MVMNTQLSEYLYLVKVRDTNRPLRLKQGCNQEMLTGSQQLTVFTGKTHELMGALQVEF